MFHVFFHCLALYYYHIDDIYVSLYCLKVSIHYCFFFLPFIVIVNCYDIVICSFIRITCKVSVENSYFKRAGWLWTFLDRINPLKQPWMEIRTNIFPDVREHQSIRTADLPVIIFVTQHLICMQCYMYCVGMCEQDYHLTFCRNLLLSTDILSENEDI